MNLDRRFPGPSELRHAFAELDRCVLTFQVGGISVGRDMRDRLPRIPREAPPGGWEEVCTTSPAAEVTWYRHMKVLADSR